MGQHWVGGLASKCILDRNTMSEKLTKKQSRQLDKLVKENYEGWIRVAMRVVGDRESSEEVVSKTFLSLCTRIIDKKQIKIDIPNSKAYVSKAVYRRGLNYLRDNSKMGTLTNYELDKFTEKNMTKHLRKKGYG